MSRIARSLTFLCLLSSVALAQPAPDGPAKASEPPTEPASTETPPNPPPTDQPLIPKNRPPSSKKKPTAGFDKGFFFLRSDDEKYALKITQSSRSSTTPT